MFYDLAGLLTPVNKARKAVVFLYKIVPESVGGKAARSVGEVNGRAVVETCLNEIYVFYVRSPPFF